jgi:hypothetical protein
MKILHIGFSPVTDGWNYQDNLLPKYNALLEYRVWYLAWKKVCENIQVIKEAYLCRI